MTIQTIGLGGAANDGSGDPLRVAGGKINDNFAELESTKADINDTRIRPLGAFVAHKNGTNQTGVAFATDTKVSFPTERFDLGSFYDAANSKWMPPAGLVAISAQTYINGTISAGQAYIVAIWKNGAVLAESFNYSGAANNGVAAVSVVDQANGSDYYEAYVRVSPSSGTATVDGTAKWTYFSGAMI